MLTKLKAWLHRDCVGSFACDRLQKAHDDLVNEHERTVSAFDQLGEAVKIYQADLFALTSQRDSALATIDALKKDLDSARTTQWHAQNNANLLAQQLNAPIKQLEAWRSRWHPQTTEESEELLNRAFAGAFGNQDGKAVIDYLIGEYYKPIQFAGATDAGKLAERNGQQQLLIDILTRYDMGMHPMAFEPERSSDDEKPMDVRA